MSCINRMNSLLTRPFPMLYCSQNQGDEVIPLDAEQHSEPSQYSGCSSHGRRTRTISKNL